jgi:hypothetical protein
VIADIGVEPTRIDAALLLNLDAHVDEWPYS